jgi:hypothetical protein
MVGQPIAGRTEEAVVTSISPYSYFSQINLMPNQKDLMTPYLCRMFGELVGRPGVLLAEGAQHHVPRHRANALD